MHAVSVNGAYIHYSDTGTKDGLPVVFSNSLGTDHRTWHVVSANLPPSFRIIRYDKRGHGLSSAPDAPYDMQDHVDDLAGLLDHLDVANAVVVGLSVGGLIALGLIGQRPELVRALVLSDTAPKIGSLDMWQDRISAIREGGLPAIAETILEKWFSADFRNGAPEDLALWRHMLVRIPVEGYIGTCEAISKTDFSSIAANLAVPSLCVVGSEDGATPVALVQAMHALIPGSGFEVIDGAGHLPCIEKPEQFAALVLRFLSENGIE